MPRDLGFQILTRRLSILAKKEKAPFTDGYANVSDSYNFYRNGSVELHCKQENWRLALGVAEQELRRALQYGFQPAELAEARANYLNSSNRARRAPRPADPTNLPPNLFHVCCAPRYSRTRTPISRCSSRRSRK